MENQDKPFEQPTLAAVERRMITGAVQRLGALAAAKELGIGKTTLYRRLQEYKLDTHGQPVLGEP